jgi:hypothetical protein
MAWCDANAYSVGMAKVVHLNPGMIPPESEIWAFVRYLPDAKWEGTRDVSYRDGSTFYVRANASERDLASAITDATTWADQNGVSVVYVQKMANG